VQTALSPVIAVTELVRHDPSLDRIVARRRDGSDERVSDALATAITSLEQIRDILVSTEDIFNNRLDEQDFSEIDLRELFNREILPLYSHCRFTVRVAFGDVRSVRLHRSSFIHAIRNLLRNAELHAFPDGFEQQGPLFASFAISRTARQLVIAYENNGVPLPPDFTARDFLAFGRKGKNSPGKGLGGAWVDKFLELHNGSFTIEGTNPVRFRMVLPIRR
jgi:nitrogen fixation/metabolism regulation signal transduction histidine kinase